MNDEAEIQRLKLWSSRLARIHQEAQELPVSLKRMKLLAEVEYLQDSIEIVLCGLTTIQQSLERT